MKVGKTLLVVLKVQKKNRILLLNIIHKACCELVHGGTIFFLLDYFVSLH